MTRDHGQWVADYFAGQSSDVTPPSSCLAANVLYAPFSREPGVTARCASILSEVELHRAGRFRDPREKAGFIQRRAFRRFCAALVLGSVQPLSDNIFEETENGRPYLSDAPDFWFSFSACQSGFLGAWSSTHGIGVDVEDETKVLETAELAQSYFSVAEAMAVQGESGPKRLQTFYRFWTLKEAALKSIGEGLPFGLSSFRFELEPDIRIAHAPAQHGGVGRFAAYAVEGTGHSAALVLRNPA